MSLDQLNLRVYMRVNCVVVWNANSLGLSVCSPLQHLSSLLWMSKPHAVSWSFILKVDHRRLWCLMAPTWMTDSTPQTLHMLGDRNSGGGWEEFVWLRFTHSHVLRWLPFLRKFDSSQSCNNQTLGWMCVSLCVFQFSLLKSRIFSCITFNKWPVQTVMKIWTSSAGLPLEFKHTTHPSCHELFIHILPRIRFVLVSAK